METIKNDVKSFTPVDWMLIIGAASLFLPHVISVVLLSVICFIVFFFNDTATTEIYTLSLHDALPI